MMGARRKGISPVGQEARMKRTRSRAPGRALSVAVAVCTLLAGCGGSSSSSSSSSSQQAQAAASPSPSGPAPVLDENFPDPDVLQVGTTWYAYATQKASPNSNVQVATSKDLKTWQLLDTDPLPQLPAWATTGRTWAPDVSKAGNGYVMYFAAHSMDPDVQCIGVARATSPTGPFTSVGSEPLVCPAAQGGAIDPASFVDADGTRYVVWKNDGNCCGKDTWLQLQKTSPDGLKLTGPPVKLVKQDQSWEGDLVEAPTLVRHGSQYTLLYSANSYAGDKYVTGYATAGKLTGPYTKNPQPLLSTSTAGIIGPGGQDVVQGPGGTDYLAVHGWDDGLSKRRLYLLPLTWQGAQPVVKAG
jgi:arabinan endo-1,5-alpha-L-arabinosidase